MSKRVIRFELSPEGIDKAIEEINRFKGDFLRTCNELLNELTTFGKETAQLEILRLGAFDTGELADSIKGVWNGNQRIGMIYTGTYYAVFVEFGTGIVGEQNPHPEQPWDYDVNGYGEDGWYYVDGRDMKGHWTKGQPSRPFMYNTKRILIQNAPQYVARLFGAL